MVTTLKSYAVAMSGHNQEKTFSVVAETRRKWTEGERRQVVAETEAASVSSVARKHGVATSLVFRWRREAGLAGKKSACQQRASALVPVTLRALPPPVATLAAGADRGTIEIEVTGGRRIRVIGAVEMEAVKRAIAVLEGQ